MNIAIETADTVSALRTQKDTPRIKALVLLPFVLGWFLLSAPALADETATLTIEGSGEVTVVPDQADIPISFLSTLTCSIFGVCFPTSDLEADNALFISPKI